MGFSWPTVIGFFLGFAFGVGCALAVMYSIYMGGYRAALEDAHLPTPPPRYLQATEKLRTKAKLRAKAKLKPKQPSETEPARPNTR